jgi:NADPH:quinone reductase-like Zn-dependent oxidoreductase
MKAVQMAGYGASDILQVVERERPTPSAGRYLIEVHAASVNPIDWKLRQGALRSYMWPRLPLVPGFDISGTVAEAGPGATRWQVGAPVYARIDALFGGAYAQYALVGESALAHKPKNLSDVEAAAVPLAGVTALQALRNDGGLQRGQHVLVVGGSGGVGHFAVQIAKLMGAHVVASCSTPNVAMLHALGADEVIDYRVESYRRGPAAYDVILDTAVSSPFRTFAPLLGPRGRYVAATPSPELFLRAPLLLLGSRRRIKFVMLKVSGADLEQLTGWIEAGQLRPVIDRVYPLSQAAAAHAQAEQGHVRGKIVLDLQTAI